MSIKVLNHQIIIMVYNVYKKYKEYALWRGNIIKLCINIIFDTYVCLDCGKNNAKVVCEVWAQNVVTLFCYSCD